MVLMSERGRSGGPRVRRSAWWAMAALAVVSALSAASCSSDGDTTAENADGDALAAEGRSVSDDEADGRNGNDGDGAVLDLTDDATDGSADGVGAAGDLSDGDPEGAEVIIDSGGDGGGGPIIPADDPVAEILGETGDGLTGDELEQYLAERFKAYWLAFDRARARPADDPERAFPQLQLLAEGSQLADSHLELQDLFDTGQAYRLPDTRAVEVDRSDGDDGSGLIRVRVDSVEGGVAELAVCLVNDRVRYQVEDGAVISANVISVRSRATMARNEGTWKLIDSQATDIQPGVAGCWTDEADQFPW